MIQQPKTNNNSNFNNNLLKREGFGVW